jgi:hypothetical protein
VVGPIRRLAVGGGEIGPAEGARCVAPAFAHHRDPNAAVGACSRPLGSQLTSGGLAGHGSLRERRLTLVDGKRRFAFPTVSVGAGEVPPNYLALAERCFEVVVESKAAGGVASGGPTV